MFKFHENIRYEHYEYFILKMFLMLISIFSCDINTRTISKWPFSDAKINAVLLNIQIKFHKYLNLNIMKLLDLDIMNILYLKCF